MHKNRFNFSSKPIITSVPRKRDNKILNQINNNNKRKSSERKSSSSSYGINIHPSSTNHVDLHKKPPLIYNYYKKKSTIDDDNNNSSSSNNNGYQREKNKRMDKQMVTKEKEEEEEEEEEKKKKKKKEENKKIEKEMIIDKNENNDHNNIGLSSLYNETVNFVEGNTCVDITFHQTERPKKIEFNNEKEKKICEVLQPVYEPPTLPEDYLTTDLLEDKNMFNDESEDETQLPLDISESQLMECIIPAKFYQENDKKEEEAEEEEEEEIGITLLQNEESLLDEENESSQENKNHDSLFSSSSSSSSSSSNSPLVTPPNSPIKSIGLYGKEEEREDKTKEKNEKVPIDIKSSSPSSPSYSEDNDNNDKEDKEEEEKEKDKDNEVSIISLRNSTSSSSSSSSSTTNVTTVNEWDKRGKVSDIYKYAKNDLRDMMKLTKVYEENYEMNGGRGSKRFLNNMMNIFCDNTVLTENNVNYFFNSIKHAVAYELLKQLDSIKKNGTDSIRKGNFHCTSIEIQEIKKSLKEIKQMDCSKEKEKDSDNETEDCAHCKYLEGYKNELKNAIANQKNCHKLMIDNYEETKKMLIGIMKENEPYVAEYQAHLFVSMFQDKMEGTCMKNFSPSSSLQQTGDKMDDTNDKASKKFMVLNTFANVLEIIGDKGFSLVDVSVESITITKKLWDTLSKENWLEQNVKRHMSENPNDDEKEVRRKYEQIKMLFNNEQYIKYGIRKDDPARRFNKESMIRCCLSGIPISVGDEVFAARLCIEPNKEHYPNFGLIDMKDDTEFIKNELTSKENKAKIIRNTLDVFSCIILFHANLDQYEYKPVPYGSKKLSYSTTYKRRGEEDIIGTSSEVEDDDDDDEDEDDDDDLHECSDYDELLDEAQEFLGESGNKIEELKETMKRSKRKKSRPSLIVLDNDDDDDDDNSKEEEGQYGNHSNKIDVNGTLINNKKKRKEIDTIIQKREETDSHRDITSSSSSKKLKYKKNSDTLCDFLHDIGYDDLFINIYGNSTLEELGFLTDSDFKEMGLTIGQIRKIQHYLHKSSF
jgi:hypothetical protein